MRTGAALDSQPRAALPSSMAQRSTQQRWTFCILVGAVSFIAGALATALGGLVYFTTRDMDRTKGLLVGTGAMRLPNDVTLHEKGIRTQYSFVAKDSPKAFMLISSDLSGTGIPYGVVHDCTQNTDFYFLIEIFRVDGAGDLETAFSRLTE